VSAVPAGIVVSGTRQRQAWLDRVLPPVERVRPGLWSIPTPFPGSPLRYVHLERTGYVTNKGIDVDDWHALRETAPKLG
jgi:hypothetical protein